MSSVRRSCITLLLFLSMALAASGQGANSSNQASPGVQHAERFSGADWCAQIVAAQAALPASGGVIDARSLPAGTCAGGLTVGAPSKPVYLELGRGTYAVQDKIVITTGSQIHGLGALGSGAFPTYLAATGRFPAGTTLLQFDPVNVCYGCVLHDIGLTCSSFPGCTGIDMGRAQENTLVSNVFINNFTAVGITIISDAVGTQNFTIEHVHMWAAAGAPASWIGIKISGLTSDEVQLLDISITSNKARGTAGVLCVDCNLNAHRVHVEKVTDGMRFVGTNAGGTVTGLEVQATVSNAAHITNTAGPVAFLGLRNYGPGKSIVNDYAGADGCNDSFISLYAIGAGGQLKSTCTSTLDRLPARTFSGLRWAPDGSVVYCSDCNASCTAGGGKGRTCFRENGSWTH